MTLYTDSTIKAMINMTRNELLALLAKSISSTFYLVLASEHSPLEVDKYQPLL